MTSGAGDRAGLPFGALPSGTRDVLPDEMRELRAISEAVMSVLDEAGYGEVSTPALEYETTLAMADVGEAKPVYRLFDEQGNVLVLRSDMTAPIARLVATRYGQAAPPLRFCYLAHAYRGVRPQRGQPREFLQAGVELVGAPSPEGTVEALTLLCAALDAAGLADYRIGLGDAALFPALLDAAGVPDTARGPLLHELATRDFVGLEREARALGLAPDVAAIPQRRGGPEVLDGLDAGADGLRMLLESVPSSVAGRLILDLGLARSLDYYTGAVFEVYDPALGAPLGGGGRYDDLLGRFGRPLPAVGWALNVERLHIALLGEGR
jgi:ATP phosphoribosyltransferase regulatory subunit